MVLLVKKDSLESSHSSALSFQAVLVVGVGVAHGNLAVRKEENWSVRISYARNAAADDVDDADDNEAPAETELHDVERCQNARVSQREES